MNVGDKTLYKVLNTFGVNSVFKKTVNPFECTGEKIVIADEIFNN